MSHLAITVLGSLQITLGDAPVTAITSPKIQALLSFLAVEADRTHSRETLAELLWSGQKTGRQNLRKSLSRLQTALPQPAGAEPFFHVTRQRIGFNSASSHTLDLTPLGSALAAVRRHPHTDLSACSSCCAQLADIVDLYRGDFLEGLFVESVPFDEWAMLRREWLRREVLWALDLLACHHAQTMDFRQSLHFARRQIDIDPLREEAHRQVMSALAADGHRNEALTQYETLVDLLRSELDVAPAQETTALYETIRTTPRTGSTPRPFPPSPRHNLPPQFTPFIGRTHERQEVHARLDQPECRLLTLRGAGGVGKSRLAIQVGRERQERYADGVWFVPLAALSSAAEVIESVADVLAVHLGSQVVTTAARTAALLRSLRARQMLLILDNLEHLLTDSPADPGADIVAFVVDLLQQTAGVDLLITSRQSVDLRAEWICDVSGLPYPAQPTGWDATEPERYAAVDLFVRAAQRAQPAFTLDAETAPAVQRICALVGGVPLALELAAAGVRRRVPRQIAQDIKESLDALATTMRDVPARHRSLRATFEDSWKLLDADAQIHFRRLAVFQGSFDTSAATAVAAVSSAALTTLVDRSLVQRQSGFGGERLILHETLRQFAAERLSAHPADVFGLCERHCHHYTSVLAQLQQRIEDGDEIQATAILRQEMENVRAAWLWATAEGDLDALARGMHGLLRHYVLTNRAEEGEHAFAGAVRAVQARLEGQAKPHPIQVALLADLLAAHARMLFKLARYADAVVVATRAVQNAEAVGAPTPAARAWLYKGIALLYQAAHAEAQACFERALTLARSVGRRKIESDALRSLGIVHDDQGDETRAEHYYAASLAISRAIGDLRGASASLGNLGVIQRRRNNHAQARTSLEQALAIHQKLGDGSSAGRTLTYLGELARDQADWQTAESYLRRACQTLKTIRDRHHEADALVELARLYQQLERRPDADPLLNRAITLYREIGDRSGAAEATALLEERQSGRPARA